MYISEGIAHDLDIRELLCGSNIVAVIFLIPVTSWMGVGVPVSWVFSSAGMAISTIALISTVAYLIFFYTIKTAGPVFASQCSYVVTISGVLWGMVIFSEVHTIWLWLSVVVMMAGLALVTPAQSSVRELAKRPI